MLGKGFRSERELPSKGICPGENNDEKVGKRRTKQLSDIDHMPH